MRLSWPLSVTCESEEKKKDSCRGEAMDQDRSTADHSSTKDKISKTEEESNEMKDFVFKHLQAVTEQSNGSLHCKPDDYSIEENSTPTPKNLKVIRKSCKNTQGAVFTGNILSFSCSLCKDDFTYSPNDLLKHFKESHKDSLPSYPCDLCGFVTNEFPDLQRHRIGHRNTLVTCEICNNNVQFSLLMLTRHYIMSHSVNGRFQCKTCEFKTLDAGTFVQHIHHHNEGTFKCLKCPHVSLNKDEYQRHLMVHTSKLSFNCQICGYASDRIEYLKKHTITAHGEETGDWINVQRAEEDEPTPNSSATKKLLLKEDSKCSRRISKRNCVSGKSEFNSSSEMTLRCDKMIAKKNKNGSKCYNTSEQQATSELTPPKQFMMQDCENSSETASHNNPNGLVLKLKNKLSIPPNCTTKVIGFKVVDGKKHLVLKVLPASQVESPTEDQPPTKDFVESIRKCKSDGLAYPHCVASQNISKKHLVLKVLPASQVESPTEDQSPTKDFAESIRKCKSDGLTYPCCIAPQNISPSGDVLQDDIVAVKVKVEEEEIPLGGFTPDIQKDECKEPAEMEQNCSIQSTAKYSVENMVDQIIEKTTVDSNLIPAKSNRALNPVRKSKRHKSLLSSIKVDLPSDINPRLLAAATSSLESELSENNPDMTLGGETFPIQHEHDLPNGAQNCKKKGAMPLSEMHSTSTSYAKQPSVLSKNSLMNTPNDKVFRFHNYSKDSFNISPHSQKPYQPPHQGFIETMPETDGDHGQCTMYAEEQTTEDTSESIFEDFNIIKVEEDIIPVSQAQPESISLCQPGDHEKSILVVKEHSDAIINHQLNKERVGSCPDGSESGKPAKTTLRFFQIPEGKQQMLLQTAQNKYALPVQLQGNTSFKLITRSNNPRINVSYLKPGFEFSSNPTDMVASENGREMGKETPILRPNKTGATSGSAVTPNVSTISNHYLLNSTGFNGPVLVSKTGQGSTVNKNCVKKQQTCYLVQRSLQVVRPPPSNVGLKLASSQVPLGSGPILAMPLNPAMKSNVSPTGRQAYLVRYVSQAASGNILSNLDCQTVTQAKMNGESTGSKVLYRIVTPSNGLFAGIVPTANHESFGMSKMPNDMAFTSVKNVFPGDRVAPEHASVDGIFQSQSHLKGMENPWPTRQPSQRKRRRKTLFDELPLHKARKLANKTLTTEEWHPVNKDVERTLRLCPFSPLQQIKCPRRHQPVVVLNHPDADIPEVASIMKSVNRYRGAVTKVSLSHQTVQALSVHNQVGSPGKAPVGKSLPPASNGSRLILDQRSVRERFLLKLKLKKKGRRKYEVVKTLSSCSGQPIFDCWFCGRLFNSQEDWVGHGQRHLMEATRDWNKLF